MLTAIESFQNIVRVLAAHTEDNVISAISADGKTGVIGFPNFSSGIYKNIGKVDLYNYVGDAWTKVGELTTDNRPGDLFGYSMAVSADGSVIAIGAPYRNFHKRASAATGSEGAGYIYKKKGSRMMLLGRITSPRPTPYEKFGIEVKVSEDGHAVTFFNARGVETNIDVFGYSYMAKPEAVAIR